MKFKAAKEQAHGKAFDDFDAIIQERGVLKIHPPAGIVVRFLLTQNSKNVARPEMHRPDADCLILTQRTWEVVQNEVIENLFAIVQKNNVQVSMSVAMI